MASHLRDKCGAHARARYVPKQDRQAAFVLVTALRGRVCKTVPAPDVDQDLEKWLIRPFQTVGDCGASTSEHPALRRRERTRPALERRA